LVANLQNRVHIPDPNPPPIKITPLPELTVSAELRAPELPSQKYERYEEIIKPQLEASNRIGQQLMAEVREETHSGIDKILEKYRM